MKSTVFFILVFIVFFLLGCKTKVQYVPVESVRVEYKDNYLRDSIFMYDSIHIKEKGDTVFMEKLRYIYKDKLIRDSVFICDSIAVPYEVEKIVREKYVSSFQSFQIWCGRILLLALVVYFGIRFVRKRI
ncbi:MAG: hypothetical protein LIO93_04170 [Bacteroidales bacterium]|nr:hypothetical protein [Bacteroidales bacterium]